jgi:DNA-binding SARP family transcriptional activator
MTRLWPESDRDQARNLLKSSVYVLRQTLGQEAIDSVGDNIRLVPGALDVDVQEFEAARARGDLVAAAALHRGPFLDGFFLKDTPEFDHWVDRERARLSDAYAKTLESLAGDAEARGDHEAAAEWWKARAAQDPFDSRVALRLMGALVAVGNRAGAIRHATIFGQLLKQELGIESEEVEALQQRLLTQPDAPPPTKTPPAPSREPPPVTITEADLAVAPSERRRGWAIGAVGVAAATIAIALFVTTRPSQEDLTAEIAQAVVRELGGGAPRPTRPTTVNVVAWDLYVQASRPEVLRSDSAVLVAIGQLRRAVELDPSFTDAHTTLARLYLRGPSVEEGVQPIDRFRSAASHATAAIGLDDMHAEGHATLGLAHRSLYQFAEAEAHLLRSLEIEPGSGLHREWLSQLYIGLGRFDEALAQAQLALAAEPLSPTARAEVGRALLVNGRCGEALALLAPLADLEPPLLRVAQINAQCYAQAGMWDAAIAEALEAVPGGGGRSKGILTHIMARAGRLEEADALLAELVEGARNGASETFYLAVAHAGFGRKDETFEWLERASADYSLTFEVMEPMFADVRDDPRFGRIARLFGHEGA